MSKQIRLALAFGTSVLLLPGEVRAQSVTLGGETTTTSDALTLIWSEEFNYNGQPDPNLWSYDLGNGGWGNGELQTYTSNPSNVIVQNGSLKITARQAGTEFTSARIKTDDKFSFTYGTIEARIKVPDMDAGVWPAFWTMGSDFFQVGWPKSGEIDIMEMGQGLAINEGVVNQRVVSAAHWDIFGQYATYAKHYDNPLPLNDDYHIYKLEWTDKKMATYVDGNWIWEIDIGDDCPSCSELHQPHHILLSMAVGGGFTSGGTSSSAAGSGSSGCGGSSSAGSSSSGGCSIRGPDDITAPMPADLLVDWVRLYDNGFTRVYTPAPTPSPTVKVATALTPEPTLQPTPAPVLPVTNAPLTNPPVLPVTYAPLLPVTQSPNERLPATPVSGSRSGKGGKAGKGGGSRSRQSTSGKAGSKAVTGSRSGVRQFGGKGKGKGGSESRSGVRQFSSGKGGKGKGKWSRSGTTAAGTTRINDVTPSGSTVTSPTSAPPATTAPPTPLATTNRQPPLSTPFPTNRAQVDGTDFEPMDDDEDDYNDDTVSGQGSGAGSGQGSGTSSGGSGPGPLNLVTDPFSGSARTRMNYILSILLPGILALGLMAGAPNRLY